MYTFGDFEHELDYILLNDSQLNIFSKKSLINGKINPEQKPTENKLTVVKSSAKKNKVRKFFKYFGINNLENCCFVNATLQVVFNDDRFVSVLREYETSARGNSLLIETLLNYYKEIKSAIESSNKSSNIDYYCHSSSDCVAYCGRKSVPVMNPCLELIQMLGFTKNQHEDAEEFLTKLLSTIHEDLLKCETACCEANETEDITWVEIGKGGKSMAAARSDGGEMSAETPLSRLLSGHLVQRISRRNRACTSTKTPFFILPLNIQSESITSVESAIVALTSPEKLFDSQSTDRRVLFGNLPPLLIVQLKRFTFTMETGIEKIQKHIKIDLNLSIPDDSLTTSSLDYPQESQADSVVNRSDQYSASAIVFHIGEGVNKGHYTAAVRDAPGRWLYIDDSAVFVVQGDKSIEWLMNGTSADIPEHLLTIPLEAGVTSPRLTCVSGRRSPYLIFYSKN